jgi:hypothetical protein
MTQIEAEGTHVNFQGGSGAQEIRARDRPSAAPPAVRAKRQGRARSEARIAKAAKMAGARRLRGYQLLPFILLYGARGCA